MVAFAMTCAALCLPYPCRVARRCRRVPWSRTKRTCALLPFYAFLLSCVDAGQVRCTEPWTPCSLLAVALVPRFAPLLELVRAHMWQKLQLYDMIHVFYVNNLAIFHLVSRPHVAMIDKPYCSPHRIPHTILRTPGSRHNTLYSLQDQETL